MEKKAAVVCGTSGLLGLVAVVLGFVGEGTKSQSFVRYDGVNCVYRATPALGCGVVAALFLLAAQAVVAGTTACCGCCRTPKVPSGTKRVFAVAMAVVSWVLMFIAVGVFFVAARWNVAVDRPPARGSTSSEGECYVLQGGVFTTASVLSLFVVAFGITSYFLLGASTPAPEMTQHQEGIAMGQPAPYFQPHGGWPYDGKAPTTTV